MKFCDKRQALTAEMARFKTPQDRLAHVIQMARKSPSLPAEFKTPELKLEGCLANLWLRSEFRDGACYFQSDSDSAIVKGLAAIICNLFSDEAPAEILRADLTPLREAGLWQQLTPNRRTGLARMVDRIHDFARAHQ
jgi:cysteine desulfuration protein SufE